MLKGIVKLDIFDLNWDISSKEINQVEITSSGKLGILEGVIRLFFHVLMSVLYFKCKLSKFNSRVLLMSGTRNQFLALDKLNLSVKASHIKFGNQTNRLNNDSFEMWPYLISIFFIPLVIYKYFIEEDVFRKQMLLCRLDRFVFSYGLYIFYHLVLDSKKVNIIFLSNDHSVWQRTMLRVCKTKGIKTAYVQHANVSKLFPKLIFDYAFLDGKYAEECYSNSECKIFLVGCLRFHKLKKNTKPTDKKILVCFNKIDSEADIINCVKYFISKNYDFNVRLHPTESRQSIIKFVNNSLSFSNVSSEKLEYVLSSHSYCFSGTSSIFLEASIFGLKCFSIRRMFFDYYDFEKNNIVRVFGGLDDINIDEIPDIDHKSVGLYDYVDYDLRFIESPAERIDFVLRNNGVY